jgi:hypothetical protein
MTSMSDPRAARRLHLVPTTQPDESGVGWFCGHCAERFDPPNPDLIPRVCPSCSLGMVLCAANGAIPGPDTPFLIVDSSLTVQAVSDQAEKMLGISEASAVNRHVTELLIPSDSERNAASSMAAAITAAAAGADPGLRVAVRPSNTFGVRLFARIAACWPPRAALIALG